MQTQPCYDAPQGISYFCQDTDPSISSFSQSFISRLHNSISEGHHFSEAVPALRVNESELVCSILQMLQGFSSTSFYWDNKKKEFCIKTRIHVSHLSQAALYSTLDRFIFGGTCLKLVERFVKMVDTSRDAIPTLRAFTCCVSSWLKRLRDVSLNEEVHSMGSSVELTSTLLQIRSSLSSVCSGAEYLLQIVYGAIPCAYFDSQTSVPAGQFAVHILDHLFLKLNEASLVQGSEEEEYHMLVAIFAGTILPYIDRLHSWLCDGILDDPYNEMFFFANSVVSIDQPEFWEKSYVFRQSQQKQLPSASMLPSQQKPVMQDKGEAGVAIGVRERGQKSIDGFLCPLFLKGIASAIVSAGKSLQLVQHVGCDSLSIINGHNEYAIGPVGNYSFIGLLDNISNAVERGPVLSNPCKLEDERNVNGCHDGITVHLQRVLCNQGMRLLTLSELFLLSLVGLTEDGRNIHEYLTKPFPFPQEVVRTCVAYIQEQQPETKNSKDVLEGIYGKWYAFLVDTIIKKSRLEDFSIITKEDCTKETTESENYLACNKQRLKNDNFRMDQASIDSGFHPENPALTLSRDFLLKNKGYWNDMNISKTFHLRPLNHEILWNSLFGEKYAKVSNTMDLLSTGTFSRFNWTNFTFNSKFDLFEPLCMEDDARTLESMFPFPTFLPGFQEHASVPNLIPFQKNSTLASSIIPWIQSSKPKRTPLPTVIIQQCLILYIKKQVDLIGRHILSKLMNDWKLMHELGVLRAIYLLGSGDLLQQFLIVIFGSLDKGDSLDDDFELNTLLQASIRNSADSRMLNAPDSLVVSFAKSNAPDDGVHKCGSGSTPRKAHNLGFGIDALNMLKFTYKVSWPLDLIINMEAIQKYNLVMCFLLKVKRAKFALDKARRWMWKCKGRMSHNHKHHLLVEQKLLHFVDAFHQYVMDRVYHSAWLDLCNGMESANSLDEVIEAHESYLLSIQRQCFVAPDKLWALIASRVKVILGLALDFYSVQQTLVSGGAALAIKARCEMEVDRIEKQFDDCISFLLRILSFKLNVGHFPHLADLVTRINYNHFYMSDNGNLLTVQNFETSSTKFAKPSLI